jgi:hypothetical protein
MLSVRLTRFVWIVYLAVFVFSLATVETRENAICPWIKEPSFLETDSELGLVSGRFVAMEPTGAGLLSWTPAPAPLLSRTSLLLNICRAPPPTS